MNKTIIALSLALAASAGSFVSAASAEDAFQITPSTSQPLFVAGVVTDLNAGVDYTATASVNGASNAPVRIADENSLQLSY
ncbi:hypothetical protein WNZ14_07585 [Hoeflea sp. AS60]|uniref:hypothetical protein n=1 Tax=Hoeflea sp. AS60 TaxID=3135780 RepID=UPI003181C504